MEQSRTRASFADAVCLSIPGDSPRYMDLLKAVFESMGKDVEFNVKCKNGMHYYLIWPKEHALKGKKCGRLPNPEDGAPPWIKWPKE